MSTKGGAHMGTDMEKGMGRGMTREAAETLLCEVMADMRNDAPYAAWRRGLAYTERAKDILKEDHGPAKTEP